MCTAHAFSTTYYKLLRTRKYKEFRKGWDVSAIKTSRLDLKPVYIKKAPHASKNLSDIQNFGTTDYKILTR